MAKKKAVRRKKVAPSSIGLTPAEAKDVSSGALDHLAAQVEEEGGAVLGRYNDPFGGQPLLLVALPSPASSRRRTSGTRPRRTSSG